MRLRNPLIASLIVMLSGGVLGFLSVIPDAYIRGHFSSHTFFMGELTLQRWNEHFGWKEWQPLDDLRRGNAGRVRIVFTGSLDTFYAPRRMLEQALDAQGELRYGSDIRRQWGTALFRPHSDVWINPRVEVVRFIPSITEMLNQVGFPSEQAVASILLDSIERQPSTACFGKEAAVAFELGHGAPVMSVALPGLLDCDLHESAFKPLSHDEMRELIDEYGHPSAVDERLMPPLSVWPQRIEGPLPIVLHPGDLHEYGTSFFSRTPWSDLLSKETSSRFAVIGGLVGSLGLVMYWMARWRRGLARLVFRGAAALSSRAGAIDRFMEDPPPDRS